MNIIKTLTLTTSKFLNLYLTEYKDKVDKDKSWVWVGRPNNRKAVIIVAEVEGEFQWVGGYKQDNKLVVIKEFRIPICDYEWGFPAGLIDGDEPVEDAVKRELKEETGLDVKEISLISPFIFSTAGITNESVAIAYVKATGELSNKNLESSEDIETFLMNQQDVKKLLEDKDKNFGAKAWIVLNTFAKHGRVI